MEHYDCDYPEAMKRLSQMKLNLICSEAIVESKPLQVALITAVNTGKRAFLGGVFVQMPPSIPSLLAWPNKTDLNTILQDLGATLVNKPINGAFTINFGCRSDVKNNSIEIVCNGWQGGFAVDGELIELNKDCNDLPLGGIAAAALAVGTAFFIISGVCITAGDNSQGISLWRPDLNWLSTDAIGPKVTVLPTKYWLLGLGHLGQAFSWTISLLPYRDAKEVMIWLQDDDLITNANRSGGLLSEEKNEGHYKTRVTARFLESHGFKTKIIEKRFDQYSRRSEGEPLIALCGFDKAEGRRSLEKAGFHLIVEAALGGDLALFDNIIVHTFPGNRKTPEAIWIDRGDVDEGSRVIREQFAYLNQNGCGVLADALSKTAVSSSFVGAFASALAIGELIRGLHVGKGIRYDTIIAQLRNIEDRKAIVHSQKTYKTEMATNGFINAGNNVI
jgi:hypothetical protein